MRRHRGRRIAQQSRTHCGRRLLAKSRQIARLLVARQKYVLAVICRRHARQRKHLGALEPMKCDTKATNRPSSIATSLLYAHKTHNRLVLIEKKISERTVTVWIINCIDVLYDIDEHSICRRRSTIAHHRSRLYTLSLCKFILDICIFNESFR